MPLCHYETYPIQNVFILDNKLSFAIIIIIHNSLKRETPFSNKRRRERLGSRTWKASAYEANRDGEYWYARRE